MSSRPKRCVLTIGKEKWQTLVVHPVMEALEEEIVNSDCKADVSHVTRFILTGLENELEEMIEHVAYAARPRHFASLIILASAAPKLVYTTLCYKIHAFVRYVTTASSLYESSKAAVEHYFSWLGQIPTKHHASAHPAAHLSLMFIRDAAFVSSPFTVGQLVEFGTHLKEPEVERQLKLLTLSMCGNALATPGIRETENMKDLAPILVR